MKKILACVFCVNAMLFQTSYAQITSFNKIFGYTDGYGEWLDGALGVYELTDSSFFVLSISQGIQAMRQPLVITKLSNDGNILFEEPYGASSTFYYAGQQGTMIRTVQGHFAVAGSGGLNHIDTWATLWMFGDNGDSILQKNYGSLGESDSLEILYDVVQLPDSGFAMVGVRGLNQDSVPILEVNPNVYLLRTDAAGNLLWQKTYDKSFDDEGLHLEMFDSSHLIIAGYKHAYASPNDTPWVFVTDLYGNIVTERSFPNPPYNCWQLIGPRLFKAIDQNFLFAGCLNGPLQNGFYDNPVYLAKMDTSLNFIWEHDFNSANLIYIYNAIQNDDSSIMVIGYQQDSINNRDWGWVAKLDNDGNMIWDKLYKHGSSFTNYLFDIAQTFDCGFVVSGTTIAQNNQESWLLKMDRFGCINPVCDTLPGSCAGIPTSVNQWQEVSLLTLDASLFPNPASDELNVFYNLPEGTKTAQLIIFDMNGRKMVERKLSHASHTSTIDVNDWAGGLYLCEIKTAKELLTKKFLVGR